MTVANEDSRLAAEAIIRCPQMLTSTAHAMRMADLRDRLEYGESIIISKAEVDALRVRNAALEKVAEAAREIHVEEEGDDACWVGILNLFQALDKIPK